MGDDLSPPRTLSVFVVMDKGSTFCCIVASYGGPISAVKTVQMEMPHLGWDLENTSVKTAVKGLTGEPGILAARTMLK